MHRASSRIVLEALIRSLTGSVMLGGLLAVPCLTGCVAPEDTHYEEPDVAAETRSAAWTLEVDLAHPDLQRSLLDPQAGPVTIVGPNDGSLRLTALAKIPPNRPDVVWLELFVENRGDNSLRDVVVTFESLAGGTPFDVTLDPFTPLDAQDDGVVPLSGIAAGGVERVAVAAPLAGGNLQLQVSVEGTTTKRIAHTSSPVVVTPDGGEAWIVVPDANVVAVVDTSNDSVVREVAVAGRPTGVAISPDGRFAFVAASEANEIHVFDRSSGERLQTFGEADGVGRDPRHVVAAADGSRVFVSSYVGDVVNVIGRHGDAEFRLEAAIPVGRRPTGLSVALDGKHVVVGHFLPKGVITDNESWVSVIDVASEKVVHEALLDDVFNLDTASCLADVFGVSPSRMTSEGIRMAMGGAFMSPSGTRTWTPTGALAAFPVVERGVNADPLIAAFEPRPGEMVPGTFQVIDTRIVDEAQHMINPAGVERPVDYGYVSCAKFGLEIEMNEPEPVEGEPDQVVPRFAAFPGGVTGLAASGSPRAVAFTRGGRVALGVGYVSDHLIAFDGATLHQLSRRPLTLSGSNPTGVAITPNGQKAYVAYENSTFTSVLDLSAYAEPEALSVASYVPYEYKEVPGATLGGNGIGSKALVRHIGELAEYPPIVEVGQVELVQADPMDPEMRLGRRMFTSANPEKWPQLAPVAMTACASCHPDGASDGSIWTTMEGERRTMSLRGGVAGRGWLHAAASHTDIHEFIDIVATERLGATLSAEELDAFSTYVAFGIPQVQPPKVDESLAAEGEVLFEALCAECHMGERHTSGMPDPANPWGGGSEAIEPELYDVDTAVATAYAALPQFFESLFPPLEAEVLALTRGDRDLGEGDRLQEILDFRQRPTRLRGELKAPALVALWEQVIYFHDGRFDNLHDVVEFMAEENSIALNAEEVDAVVEYLKTL